MTIFATLTADLDFGEGNVKLRRDAWSELDGLSKADILKDWISELEGLYDDSLIEWKEGLSAVIQ